MRRLLARLRRRGAAPPASEPERLLRVYRETLAEVRELRRAA